MELCPNIAPKQIMENLEKDKDIKEVPLFRDLYNYLTRYNKKKIGDTNMSLGELAKWCDDHCMIPSPSLIDEPYVLNHNFFFNDCDDENIEMFEAGDQFRFILSTRALLELSSSLVVLQTDATYKLIWNGFPVLIIGGSDAKRRFFPIAIAVCSAEKHLDFKFIFDSLQKGKYNKH